jgi:phosphate starvation-inducible PhoH-like protein
MSSQGSSAVVKMQTKRKTNYKGASNKQEVTLTPKNENQALYMKALNESAQVITVGPAGTGKTYVVATHAANRYTTKQIDKIIITRPHVAVGKELGFLKGDIEDKTLPWAMPVLDVLSQHLGKGAVDTGIKNGNIEVAPMALMRGRSFDNAYIIIDEAQNITIPELKMVVTRVGENCTLVLNGDIKQSDIKEQSGLSKAIHLAKKYSMDAPVIEFTTDDIVRSDICKQWIIAFDAESL